MNPGFASAEAAYLQPPDGWTAKEEDQIEAAHNALLRMVFIESAGSLTDVLDAVPESNALTDEQRRAVLDGASTELTHLARSCTTNAKDTQ